MIPFNVPPCVGDELDYVKQAIDSHIICGDGAFTKQCNAWLEERFRPEGPADHQRHYGAGHGHAAVRYSPR